MNKALRYAPWVVVGLAVFYLFFTLMAPAAPSDQMNIPGFGDIPILEKGRYKPLDTFARNTLMAISNKEAITIDKETWTGKAADAGVDRESLSATRWLLDTLAYGLAQRYQTFLLFARDKTDAEVLAILGLDPERGPRYRIRDLTRNKEFAERVDAIFKKDKNQRTELDERLLALAVYLQPRIVRFQKMVDGMEKQHINIFDFRIFRIENDQVLAQLGLKERLGLRYSWNEINDEKFLKFKQELIKTKGKGDKQRDLTEAKAIELDRHLNTFLGLVTLEELKLVPPTEASGKWRTLGEALNEAEMGAPASQPAEQLTNLLVAYASGDVKKFNQDLEKYLEYTQKQWAAETSSNGLESFFNHFSPFYQCLILYVGIFLLSIFAWLGWTDALNRSAFWLLVAVLVVHTWALAMRMYIMGRPPVTNLYSSAVFIGWGCVVLCAIIEAVFRNGFGSLIASVLGVLTMIIAMHLGSGTDTMDVPVAVLNTNFWLATHVVCITLGYVGSYVAGFLGMAYIFRGLLTTTLDRKLGKDLIYALYGVVCFAMLLSFVGTVLGGIWADQSWGRFWGWDPKENGALLIVIWNAVMLHARWGGMIKDRGLAVLSVTGNMITTWSWFGTNQLGVGLHNYGFNSTLALAVVVSWAVFGVFIAGGCIPLRFCESFQPPIEPLKSPVTGPPGPRPPKGQPSTRLRPA